MSRFRAVILDLDGVVTHTAELHIKAWKRMFDPYLEEHSRRTGKAIQPLDPGDDYRKYIDGRPRYEGAVAFLRSRGIDIPFGSPDDDPGKDTVCGLGNLKNQLYLTLLREEGAHVFNDALVTIRKWRNENIRTAVISASRNCRQVLEAAGITDLFDVIVDGVDSGENKLRGKPEPDIFLFAAEKLEVYPSESVILEDSSAGVTAGAKGKFAWVVGVSRDGDTNLLYESGADKVIASLEEISDLSKEV